MKLRTILPILLLTLVTGAWVCTNTKAPNWEQTTLQSLSAAKATIDCASAAYNRDNAQITQFCGPVADPTTLYLPQTQQVHDILFTAQQAKDAAVNAFLAYEKAKAVQGSDAAALQANVNSLVLTLTQEVVQVTALVKGAPNVKH